MVKPYEKTSSFNPPENANVVDMSLDTGSKHGHRVVAYKQGNEWYVLDPYYYGSRDTSPKPASEYLTHMKKQ